MAPLLAGGVSYKYLMQKKVNVKSSQWLLMFCLCPNQSSAFAIFWNTFKLNVM